MSPSHLLGNQDDGLVSGQSKYTHSHLYKSLRAATGVLSMSALFYTRKPQTNWQTQDDIRVK